MNYGLYLSAGGVLANAHRQDVIANNIANAETAGFKRDLALFRERLTEAQERRGRATGWTDPVLERMGGGMRPNATVIDSAQGELEPTGSPLDVAIEGDGFFAVRDAAGGGATRLTRNGQFSVDRTGQLILSDASGHQVLDTRGNPIVLAPGRTTAIGRDGTVTQDGRPVGRLGLFDVADPRRLVKHGSTLLSHPGQSLQPGAGTIHSEFVERANVDPATELAALMDTQRQLEANANMIRYQDQTLSKLVNEVGKIG